jgi:GTP-binding protein
MNPLSRFTCAFRFASTNFSNLPPLTLPEIAFYGRSNVGKSSLLNALVGRKKLARTSKTPGRTQQINFFELDKKCFLVDLPGYGYAKVSRSNQKEWEKLIYFYLMNRSTLKLVVLLIDARHGIKPNDKEIMQFLDRIGVLYQLVLTKSDKVKKTELNHIYFQIESILPNHPAARNELIITSCEEKIGMNELCLFIENIFSS